MGFGADVMGGEEPIDDLLGDAPPDENGRFLCAAGDSNRTGGLIYVGKTGGSGDRQGMKTRLHGELIAGGKSLM